MEQLIAQSPVNTGDSSTTRAPSPPSYSSLIPRLHPTLGTGNGNQTLPSTHTPDIDERVIQVEEVINAKIPGLAVIKILQVKQTILTILREAVHLEINTDHAIEGMRGK